MRQLVPIATCAYRVAALPNGYQAAFVGAAAVAVAGALAGLALLRTQRGGETDSSDDLDGTREEALAA
jgi:hypothetical protein